MKLEVNGRVVDVDDSFSQLSAADKERTVNDIAASFAIGVGPETIPPPTAGELATRGAASAAATAYGFSGDVITPRMAYDTLGRPIVQGAGETFQKYVADPFRAGRDIAATKAGSPLPAVNIMRQAAPEVAEQIGKVTSTSPLMTSPVTGSQYPESVPDYRRVQKMAGPELAQRMTDAYAKGGNSAVLDMLDRDATARRLMQDPAFAEAVQNYRGRVPQGMGQLARGLGLVGRTAARFAGPIGLASTAYDVYQAAPTVARMFQTGTAGRSGALGQTADEMPMVSGPVEPNYIDDIRRRAAERALQ